MELMSGFIILIIVSNTQSFPTGCSETEWQCSDGTCIAKSSRCDNFPDCSDGSDEFKCIVSPVCLEGLESCPQPNGTNVCVRKAIGCGCGMVPGVDNGNIVTTSNLIGSSANVTCDAGYQPSVSSIICQITGLWEPASCKPKDCGPVSEISFGTIRLANINNTTFRALGFVSCDVGYDTANVNITCQENGRWTTAMCSLKDCGSPPDIPFGNISLYNNSISTLGATALVTCDDNYTPSKPTITCDASGVWEQVSCDLSGCGNVPKINHGTIKPSGKTNFGSFANVECDVGYTASEMNVSCQRTGDWEVAKCLPKDCGSPPVIPFGYISLYNNSISTVGSKALVTCVDNYTPSKPTITCVVSGVWEQVSCDLSGCGALPKINHGTFKLVGQSTFGSFADVTCDAGYKANKTKVSCQRSGDWEKSTCIPIDCGPVPVIPFGKIHASDTGRSTYGSTATVACDTGYVTNKTKILCQTSGTWQESICKPIDCGQIPDVSFAKVHLVDISNTLYGASAHVTCNNGFKTNTSTIKCTSSGVWQAATCEVKDCGVPPIILNGRIRIINDKTTFGSIAKLECNDKYASNMTYITCLASGRWENARCLCQGNNNKDRCTEEHGVCAKHIYETVRLLALKSTKCTTFCQCIHAGTSVGGVISYKWAEHRCPAGTLFDDSLISPVCNHQFLVSC